MKINKTKYPIRTIISWLWRHHRGCRAQAVVNVIAGLLQVGLGLLGVELLRRLIDIAVGSMSGSLGWMAVALGGVLLSEMLIHIIVTWIRAVLGVRSQNRLQQYFFERLLRGQWRGVERFHSGDVLNRLFGDVGDIVGLLTEVLPSAVVILVQFCASFAYLYVLDRQMALILIVAAPIFVLFSRFYFYRMRRIVRHIKDSNSALQSIIQECVQHKLVVKVMEREQTMVDRLEQRQAVLRHQVRSRTRFSILSRSMVNIGFAGGYLAALVWGLYQLQDGLITVGVLMAFTQLIHRIQRPLLDMARLLPSLVSSMTSSERLMELDELAPEAKVEPIRLRGPIGIRFEQVDYQYTKKGRCVLRDFTHDFRPGSSTAILGETGAGKTTLIRLSLALAHPDQGRVVLYSADGREIEASAATLCNFSYVPQGNSLFSGTIRENLLLGNPSATKAQMEDALRAAMADFVLDDLPDGLSTLCGEHGGGLSEGQAQRIAIARALLRPAGVLLLDEATSALDVQTEQALLTRLHERLEGVTILFVTHRLAVADFTDEQLVIERSRDK